MEHFVAEPEENTPTHGWKLDPAAVSA